MVAMIESILEEPGRLREVEPGLFSVLDPGDAGAPFDRIAAAYDRAVSSPTYMRLAWGMTREDNARFIGGAVASAERGWLVDVAAGTCVDAAAIHARTTRPTVVLDRSIAMLRRARERVAAFGGGVPAEIVFLQADATAMPFAEGSITTLLCHGAYHVFQDTALLTDEWKRTLAPMGGLFVSSLVRGRWLGDRYLALLRRAGEIAPPRTAAEFRARLEQELSRAFAFEAVGNFAYAHACREAAKDRREERGEDR